MAVTGPPGSARQPHWCVTLPPPASATLTVPPAQPVQTLVWPIVAITTPERFAVTLIGREAAPEQPSRLTLTPREWIPADSEGVA
jgi:hypothetical protein